MNISAFQGSYKQPAQTPRASPTVSKDKYISFPKHHLTPKRKELPVLNLVTTSINKLSTGRSSVSTATTPYVSVASTPTGANAGELSFVYLGGKIPIDASTLLNADLPIDPNMPDLEDDFDAFSNADIYNGAYDDENVGAVADFNNMDDTINVSPIPTLRIHKDYPKDQILGDPNYVEAMQEELLQFKLQKVWILVDLPFRKKAIGTKWVFKNKRDERSIVVKNKARLVAQGFRQEEGIDYNEVFAPVARIEAIRREFEDCMHKRFQMSSMGELTFFLGLQVKQQPDGIFISQDKYVADILKKFDFCSIRTATTPIESNKPLVKDEDGVDVDVHVYRSMIGLLNY
ncbi:putative ribonuclease H-like domain-containing protein [Tanacetum coccineum]